MSLFGELIIIWMFMLFITSFISLGLLIWFLVRRYRKSNRTREINTIIPEYLPPKGISVSSAGTIARKQTRIFSAQLIDLAVRHYLKIYEIPGKSFFRKTDYELEIVKDISDLLPEEREILTDIFESPTVHARLDMATLKRNMRAKMNLSDNQQKLDKDIRGTYALRARDPAVSGWFKRASLFTLLFAVITLSPWLFTTAIIGFVIGLTIKPLTDRGLELARYLKGLELYIKVAETDRLRMLQSPEGAAKLPAPVDTDDKRQLVKLYERVLPYAILFGQEKQWNKQLGQYYESINQAPGWYVGSNPVFNAVAFSTAINSFNQAATSYAAPASSSSGASGGGGFSGGGGGGGGGGGW
jgi:uncharacterized membrane protein YgcG